MSVFLRDISHLSLELHNYSSCDFLCPSKTLKLSMFQKWTDWSRWRIASSALLVFIQLATRPLMPISTAEFIGKIRYLL